MKLPDGLTSLGDYAFEGCTSLASVTLPNGLTSLGYGAFWSCTSLALVYVPTGCAVGLLAFEGTAGGYAYATHRPPQYLAFIAAVCITVCISLFVVRKNRCPAAGWGRVGRDERRGVARPTATAASMLLEV